MGFTREDLKTDYSKYVSHACILLYAMMMASIAVSLVRYIYKTWLEGNCQPNYWKAGVMLWRTLTAVISYVFCCCCAFPQTVTPDPTMSCGPYQPKPVEENETSM